MKVICKTPRITRAPDNRVVSQGFDVPFGPPGMPPEKVYRFRSEDPSGEGPQTCIVTDQKHLAVFASIPEAYELEPTPDDPVPADATKEQAQAVAKKNAAKQAKEKEALKRAESEGATLKAKREQEARDLQKKLDAAALRRQKKALETKGKKSPLIEIASLDDE